MASGNKNPNMYLFGNLSVVHANRQHQIKIAVSLKRRNHAGADIGIHAQGTAFLIHIFDHVADVAGVEGNFDVLSLQMSIQILQHVAQLAHGGDFQVILRRLHANEIVFALLGHQAGTFNGVLKLAPFHGHARKPGRGQNLTVVDVFPGQQTGDQRGNRPSQPSDGCCPDGRWPCRRRLP